MKKITLTFAALIAAVSMNAQTYFEDDFNDEDISNWSLLDVDGDGNNWGDSFQVSDQDGNPVSSVALISRSWLSSGPLTPDNWAISPAIDLTDATDPVLTWNVQAPAYEWDNEHYSVYVATSQDPDELAASSVTFSETYDDPNDAGTQYPRELDLSDFAGQTVYIAFRHHNVTNMDWIAIDDVMVAEEGTASIVDLAEMDFAYTMNNSSGELSLSANTSIHNAKIYNIVGQEVMNQEIASNNGSLNLSPLPSGVYIVQVKIDGQIGSFKIVKK